MLIHPDINATRRDYERLPPNQVLVTKIFRTIQGEGPFAGQPATFVRLAGCNLGAKESCPWCDTKFTLKAGTAMEITDVVATANALVPKADLIVLTGGEPLLQNPHLLIQALIYHGWRVQIETNGYFWSTEMHELALHDALTVVLSPKVNYRQVYPPINRLLWVDSDCLKILVDADEESPYHLPPKYAFDYDRPIYVSPINHYKRAPYPDEVPSMWDFMVPTLDHKRCRCNHKYAAMLVLEYGWRLSLQTHLFAELP